MSSMTAVKVDTSGALRGLTINRFRNQHQVDPQTIATGPSSGAYPSLTPATPIHVLIADVDSAVCESVRNYLQRNEIRVSIVSTVAEVLSRLQSEALDLLLLDPKLHGSEGVLLTRAIRDRSAIPLVLFSECCEEADRVIGLELGADDYVGKPFSLRELLARIRALLRRARIEIASPARDTTVRAYRFLGWELNVRLHRLYSPERTEVNISRGEFSLLCAFLSAPQRVLTRDQLLEMSKLHSTESYDRSIDVQIMRLRRKIEAVPARPQLICTERGLGYFLNVQVGVLR